MGYELNYKAASYHVGAATLADNTAPVFIKIDSTGRADVATASSKIEGVLVNCPPLADICTVAYDGIVNMQVGGSYSIGQYLTSNATGIAVAADASSSYARAILLEATDATNDLAAVRLINQAYRVI